MTDPTPVDKPRSRHSALRESHSFPVSVIDQIHGMAEEGR